MVESHDINYKKTEEDKNKWEETPCSQTGIILLKPTLLKQSIDSMQSLLKSEWHFHRN
jgi:hypothetical protein